VTATTFVEIGRVDANGNCLLPSGWTFYTVQRGNTLFSIARAVGSTVAELRDANCLQNVDNILAGQRLFVPREPDFPVRQVIDDPNVVTSLPSNDLFVQGCTAPGVQLTDPVAGQRVSGIVQLNGTANIDGFQYYKFEIRPDFAEVFNFYDQFDVPVTNGVLGEINTAQFDPGLYWIRLVVVDQTGNFPEPCVIPMIFE